MYEVSHFLAQFLDKVPYITIEQLHLVLINFKISMSLQEALWWELDDFRNGIQESNYFQYYKIWVFWILLLWAGV